MSRQSNGCLRGQLLNGLSKRNDELGRCWIPPGCWHHGTVDQMRQPPDWVQIVGFRRVPHVFRAVTTLLSKHPREPHDYLPFVGVDPRAQGQGLGSALLQPVLRWCDTLRLGAYLENTNAGNLVFYEQLGFRVLERIVLAPEGPRCGACGARLGINRPES